MYIEFFVGHWYDKRLIRCDAEAGKCILRGWQAIDTLGNTGIPSSYPARAIEENSKEGRKSPDKIVRPHQKFLKRSVILKS